MATLGRAIVRDRSRAADVVATAAVAETARAAPMTLDQYAAMVTDYIDAAGYGSGSDVQETWRKEPAERVGTSMAALGEQAYKSSGLVFAIMAVRMSAFSLVRFTYQRIRNGRPSDLFGTPSLLPLEIPWPGGTTQDLMQRLILDVDLAGNAYVIRDGPWLLRLKPTWVQILLEPIEMNGGIVGYRKVGYTYHHGGIEVCPANRVAIFGANEVAHFAPTPDPDASYRGMSWLTSAIREISNDKTMERHKQRYFENAATPNIAVSLDKSIDPDQFAKFKAIMDEEHVGAENAYKTLYLGGGADVKVVGSNFEQLQMATVQGRGETRVAAAGGVPPVIVGLSEGLAQATYSNYGQAMRRFADITMATLWGNAAGSLQTIIRPPGSDARLWYDTRDVAFLREDREVAARIQQTNAATINTYITAGFTPESAVMSVNASDPSLLVHTGMVSVQLQAPGSDGSTGGDTAKPADAAAPAAGDGAAPAAGAPTVAEAKKESQATNAADPAAGLKGQTPAEIRLLMEMIQKVYLGINKVLTVEEARDLLNRAGADLPALAPDSPLLAPPAPKPAPGGAPAAATDSGDPAAEEDAPADDSGDAGTDGTGTNSAEPVHTARAVRSVAVVRYDQSAASRAIAGPAYDEHDAAILEYIARDFARQAREARSTEARRVRIVVPVARKASETQRDWVDHIVAANTDLPVTNGVHA